jgi:hypothetical protein
MADANDILQTAIDQFKTTKQGWAEIYQKARDDLRFLSDEPNAQWIDEKLLQSRQNRPIYQVDQLSQFIHQVSNDVRMNTPTINVIPDGKGADIETAEVFSGIIKGIEYKSNADAAYDTAVDFAIKSSLGFIRVNTRYCDDDGFEQELYIERVVNTQAVYIDHNSIQPDGSDAMCGFVLDQITVKEFKKKYPNMSPVSFGDETPKEELTDEDTIFIADYFKIEEIAETVGMNAEGKAEPYADHEKKRDVVKRVVRQYKLSGSDVLQESVFAGKYIPIVPVYGEEAWIDGKRHLLSLIRKSKQSQMMYNLTKSLEIEVLMKQPQAPFAAAAGVVSGFEDEYKDPAKVQVLTYNPLDVNGNPAQAPQRMQPPTLPQGFAAMAAESKEDIKATMGLYNTALGMKSNETSGIAIQRRQQEGDVATFHFGDNLVRSITQVGRILVFAIPEIYDTSRIVKIIGEEDEPKTIGVNGEREEGQERDFDLAQGKYDVKVITGASFTTQRQEAGAFYNQLIQSMPDLMPVIGDLVFKYQDTAGSQAIASRLKKLVDPKLLDEEEREEGQEIADPEKEQMAAALQEMQAAIQQLQAELENKQVETQLKAGELQIKNKEVEIKAFEAQSKAQEANKQIPLVDNTAELTIKARELELKEYQAQQVAQQADRQFQLEIEKMRLEALKIQMSAQPQAEGVAVEDDMVRQEQNLILAGIMERIDALTNAMQQPIIVMRDEQGNITGAV